MDKLKSVLSHGSKKSVDNTQDTPNSPGGLSGEGSHLAGANSSPTSKGPTATGNTSEEYHPIFDQFTGRATSSEPTKTSEEPFNAANLNQPSTSTMEGSTYTEKSESSPSSNLRPDAMHNSKLNTEGMSTASIKSGVLGFPQDGESHAAMGNLPGDRLDATQAETSSALPDRTLHHKRDSPDLSKDSALGAAATGTATGVSARELLGRHEEEKPVQQSHALSSDRTADRVHEPVHQQTAQEPAHQHSAIPAQQQSSEGPNVIGDTDRTFPLMGGVTSPQKQEDPATTTTHSTTEHSSTHPKTSGYPSSATEETSRSAPANPASTGLAPLTSEREPGTKDRDVGLGDGREALAGAAAAGVATTAASSAKKSEHEHGGHGHNYDGPRYIDEKEKPNTGLVFTEGPHVTDTANVIDPHLHIPGEFPDPTPVEEPSQPSFGTGGTTTGLGSTGRHADTPPSVTSATPKEEHHYGRDAALAGGAGAAGLGAYEASKHHQRETTDIDNEPAIGSSTNPYSSQKLDPRVDSKPRGLEEKRNDLNTSSPQTRDSHLGRDTAVLGGTAGAATLGGYEASKQRPQEQETIQPSSSLPQSNQGITQTQAPSIQQQPATQGISDSTEPNKQEHHYGRDAAVVGGLGAAGAGAYAYSQRDNEKDSGPASSTIGPHKSNAANVVDPRVQPDPALQKHHEAGPTSEDPASKTVGPHKSNIANILDPRVQPEPEKQKGHTTTGPHQSDTLNRLDPKADQQKQPESQHHYGRDAAVVGGTGAAGYGAYEAAQKYDQHRSTQPGAAMEEQRYDPTAQGAHDPNKTNQHHYGRDAAVVGGVGAAGAGAYAYSQRDQTAQPQSAQAYQQPTTTQQPYSTHQATQEYQPSATQQFTSTQPAAGHQRYDSAQEPREPHNKRDAAAVAGVGAAGAGAAHEYNKHEAEKAQQEQLAQQQKELAKKQKEQEHEFKHQQKELEKQQAKDKKEHDKFIAAEEKKHQKEVEKKQAHEQKEHDKLLAAEQKKHQKEVEKQEAQQQKEMDKEQQEEGKEKKHHLFGFLHRDKSKKEKEPGEPDSPTRRSKESPRTSKEYAGLGAAGAAGVGTTAAAYEAGHDSDSSGRKERNRLHKDPPKGHPAREALEHQHEHGGPGIHQHVGIDGPINRPGEISGDRETQRNVYGAHPIDDGKNLVTEPHTGLPMNVEKYGDGHGGTDGSQTVGGYHQAPGASNQAGAGSTTDWEAIKKANTPF